MSARLVIAADHARVRAGYLDSCEPFTILDPEGMELFEERQADAAVAGGDGYAFEYDHVSSRSAPTHLAPWAPGR